LLTNDVQGVCPAKKKRWKGCNMKRMFLMLAVLVMVSAAYAADVTISCAQVGTTNEVTVSYAADTAAHKPRGIALNISLSGSALISKVTKNTTNKYWVYPGTYGDANTPVASGGLGTNSMIIEMGSLHSPTGYGDTGAPAQSGEVIKFNVTPLTGTCVVTISGNAARGNIVKYDATEATVTYSTCNVSFVSDCLKTSATEYAAWSSTTWNKPNCWCYRRHCRGDGDGIKTGLYWVSTPDLNLLKSSYNKNDATLRTIVFNSIPGICADNDHTKTGLYRVTTPDLTVLKTYYNKSATSVPCCDLNSDCTLAAGDKFNFWTN